MRRGDMDQWDQLDQWEIENARAWKGVLVLGLAMVFMLFGASMIGLFFGWLIWGI